MNDLRRRLAARSVATGPVRWIVEGEGKVPASVLRAGTRRSSREIPSSGRWMRTGASCRRRSTASGNSSCGCGR
ncbi:hypothetical protein ebA2126 [Aromatoleum aromaticum EbN1]|uniref:Uncharacterized protein n=1 Tax=Aromatoleum aromaticum (strain DSM 19018 / LMG 30748 / EbN1) TaxID=76114 RepID=Q5P5W0_AROAE|nr:hypothetical protein ebA2126 [Aromatoleum aromaticum EbN1]